MATDEVGQFIESLLSDEGQRRVVLSALADSIVEAHRLHPDGWGVTLRRDDEKIRMNVGPIEVFLIAADEPVLIVVDGGLLTERLPANVTLLSAGAYETVKEAIGLEVQPLGFAASWQAVRPAHFALLRIAGDKRQGYTWKDSHSPGMLDYLRSFLGRELPNPSYLQPVVLPAVVPEERIYDHLERVRDGLLADGKLLPAERLDECYALFAANFGPQALKALDGTRLLEHMHDHGNRASLVYWLEFKDDEELPGFFGSIAGGSAIKFGIFRRKESRAWVTGSNQDQRTLSDDQAVEIARRNRAQLTAAAEVLALAPTSFDDASYAALQHRIIEAAPDVADTAWGHKYLHMLYPAKLDAFHVVDYQRFHLIKLLQVPPPTKGRYAAAGRYAALSVQLGWPMTHLGSTLNAVNGRPYRYWRIGTSDGNAPRKYWPMMRDTCLVAIGWPGTGDLSALSHDAESREKIRGLLDIHHPSSPQATGRAAQQIFNFATSIAEGHLVLASDGAHVLGIGRVTGPYQFVPGADFPHQRSVKWLDQSEWRMPEPEGLRTTVNEVRKYAQNLVAVESRVLVGLPPPLPAPPIAKPPLQKVPIPGDGVDTADIAQFGFLSPKTPRAPQRARPQLEKTAGEIQRVLERKGQVILYGPPGTGKTHWAEATARDLAAWWSFGCAFDSLDETQRKDLPGGWEKPLVRMCCFHPNYGYEDFVEGHRPDAGTDGMLFFKRQDGIFKKLCADAAKDPEHRYYLIIDEINRGDIPRIFGELMTLLEWSRRGSSSLSLPLSGEVFTVPRNVYVIGTMNTADRSITLIDIALRRRFGFVELMPRSEILGTATIEGIPLGPLLRLLNDRIRHEIGRDARNLQIGHSYFLHAGKPISDMAQLRRVLLDDIIPLLEEYCYEDWDKLVNILGTTLVDGAAQRVRRELFEDAAEEKLKQALNALDPSLATSREATTSEPSIDELPPSDDEDAEPLATAAGG